MRHTSPLLIAAALGTFAAFLLALQSFHERTVTGAVAAEDQPPPSWKSASAGNVSLPIPPDWKRRTDSATGEGTWYLGDADAPSASFSVVRDEHIDDALRQIASPLTEPAKVNGKAATRYLGAGPGEPRTRRLLIVVDDGGAGKPLGLLAIVPLPDWPRYEKIVQQMVAAVKLHAGPAPDESKVVPTPIALPNDPDAVVISLDYRGGFTLPRLTDAPVLVIRANRKVTLVDPFSRAQPIQDAVSERSLQDFLRFAIEEHNFHAIDSAALERAIGAARQKRKVGQIIDADTTIIRIRTAEREHVVRCQALGPYAAQFPDIKPLADVNAVHQRLARYADNLREWNRAQQKK